MRRCLAVRPISDIEDAPLEIGNVLSNYWPKGERLEGVYLPWRLADLSHGRDATAVSSFRGLRVLSISTVEHVGHDNEGMAHADGFRTDGSVESLKAWVQSWDAAPQLLTQIAAEAEEFLVTFPIGLNSRLDEVVASGALRPLARVLRRVDAGNAWEEDPGQSFEYHYDLRDAYLPDTIGLMFHPQLREVYREIYGAEMPQKLAPPRHPRFRFANAVCVVTNLPELLRGGFSESEPQKWSVEPFDVNIPPEMSD
ncbi:unnamed protein product [Effrenium voratum]|nr:unnamed protein product [Effrenium voratum]